MQKLKSFLKSPVGMVAGVVLVIVVVVAYSSKIPGMQWVRRLAAKLPGSDGAPATA